MGGVQASRPAEPVGAAEVAVGPHGRQPKRASISWPRWDTYPPFRLDMGGTEPAIYVSAFRISGCR
ncbi:hypothetical protein [Streptomyces sp. NBC_00140]|uniref:hypothetical protein n=1 Tax=Streptomyces sp. NBC_00140 TaxID=2975664 RepID=UPI002253325D|nr:hypothetical protein [Streptomyces sp. NBC_00140]MCX5336700.1 hypothetical protein [Streptomyces sp. NBC_00140]